jgi:hypothetical protein
MLGANLTHMGGPSLLTSREHVGYHGIFHLSMDLSAYMHAVPRICASMHATKVLVSDFALLGIACTAEFQ